MKTHGPLRHALHVGTLGPVAVGLPGNPAAVPAAFDEGSFLNATRSVTKDPGTMSAARNQRALLPATVRENENPVALLHVADETAFLDLSVGAAQDPPSVALAIHVGPFFDPSIRKADHPVAVTLPIPERPARLGLLCRQVRPPPDPDAHPPGELSPTRSRRTFS